METLLLLHRACKQDVFLGQRISKLIEIMNKCCFGATKEAQFFLRTNHMRLKKLVPIASFVLLSYFAMYNSPRHTPNIHICRLLHNFCVFFYSDWIAYAILSPILQSHLNRAMDRLTDVLFYNSIINAIAWFAGVAILPELFGRFVQDDDVPCEPFRLQMAQSITSKVTTIHYSGINEADFTSFICAPNVRINGGRKENEACLRSAWPTLKWHGALKSTQWRESGKSGRVGF